MANLIQILRSTLPVTTASISNETRRILLKEVLQAYLLDFIYNHPVYRALNFYGGTCLHIVYKLNRLSEDLDLDNSKAVDISRLPANLADFIRNNLDYHDSDVKLQQGESGIFRVITRFPVLFELGLSSHTNESLHVKLEISSHQQVAEVRKTPVFFHGRSFVPSHFSLETMMAGKMLACLEREFIIGKESVLIKGRDFYDLLWFMSQKIMPLSEKLARDGKTSYSIKEAFSKLKEKVLKIRPNQLAQDLNPLFESRAFVDAWIASFHDNFLEYLKYYL